MYIDIANCEQKIDQIKNELKQDMATIVKNQQEYCRKLDTENQLHFNSAQEDIEIRTTNIEQWLIDAENLIETTIRGSLETLQTRMNHAEQKSTVPDSPAEQLGQGTIASILQRIQSLENTIDSINKIDLPSLPQNIKSLENQVKAHMDEKQIHNTPSTLENIVLNKIRPIEEELSKCNKQKDCPESGNIGKLSTRISSLEDKLSKVASHHPCTEKATIDSLSKKITTLENDIKITKTNQDDDKMDVDHNCNISKDDLNDLQKRCTDLENASNSSQTAYKT